MWGILYYAFTVVVGPMQRDTGWERSFLNLGLSLGLLAWGACAFPVGLWIQRHGARGLMTLASALGGAALVLIAATNSPALYLTAWLLLGAAMAGSLYEPSFAVITAAFGPEYRRGITLITLLGGFASTVFIPVAQRVVDQFGWRVGTLLLGILVAAVCSPLHWCSIPAAKRSPVGKAQAAPRTGSARQWRVLVAEVRDPRFVGLAVWFSAHAAAFTGLLFQLVPLLQARGVSNSAIVTAIAFMGPLQVLGRFLLSLRKEEFSTVRVGIAAMSGLVVAMLVLLLLPPTLLWLALFAALLGLGNGVLTIVRGTAVAELFGRERYAEINGALAAPGVFAKAAAPLGMAAVWSATNEPLAVPLTALALLVIGFAGLLALAGRGCKEGAPTRVQVSAAGGD